MFSMVFKNRFSISQRLYRRDILYAICSRRIIHTIFECMVKIKSCSNHCKYVGTNQFQLNQQHHNNNSNNNNSINNIETIKVHFIFTLTNRLALTLSICLKCTGYCKFLVQNQYLSEAKITIHAVSAIRRR